MARKRMFDNNIIGSAKFMKMPSSSRLLYYDLGMRADDDGIVEAYNVMNMTGATEDDLKVLVSKCLVKILNEDLVTLIIDWNTNNYIRADRKIDSIYKNLLLQIIPDTKLIEKKPRADVKNTTWTTNGQPMDGIEENSIEENSIDNKKENIKRKKYFDKEELNNLFIDFLELRKKLKAVNSERAINELLNILSAKDDGYKKAMINQSIVNSWKSLYEVKNYQELPVWVNQENKESIIEESESVEMQKLLEKYK